MLARFGHPLKVASRYQPQKYLIGPDLYPAFLQTLKIVFVAALVIQVATALIFAQTNHWQIGPLYLLKMSVEMFVWAGAIVVLVFVSIEVSGERLRWYENWQPEFLAAGNLGVVKRSDVITNLIFEGCFLLWWNDVVVLQNWIPALGEGYKVSLSDVWPAYYWPLNVLFGLFFLLHAAVLIRGVWGRRALVTEIVGGAALLSIAIVLIASGPLVEVSGMTEAVFIENVQRAVKVTIVVIGGIVIRDIRAALKMFRGTMTNLTRPVH